MIKNKIATKIKFNNKITISNSSKVFIVAEISGNHSGNIKNILRSIDNIKASGADAIKIQSYEPHNYFKFKKEIFLY